MELGDADIAAERQRVGMVQPNPKSASRAQMHWSFNLKDGLHNMS